MCTSDRVESHTGSAGRRGAVYTKRSRGQYWLTATQIDRAESGYTIHERSRGQYWLTVTHVLRYTRYMKIQRLKGQRIHTLLLACVIVQSECWIAVFRYIIMQYTCILWYMCVGGYVSYQKVIFEKQ